MVGRVNRKLDENGVTSSTELAGLPLDDVLGKLAGFVRHGRERTRSLTWAGKRSNSLSYSKSVRSDGTKRTCLLGCY